MPKVTSILRGGTEDLRSEYWHKDLRGEPLSSIALGENEGTWS